MTTTMKIDSTTEVKCFICLNGGNLKSANICCGPTVYHPACFSRYCSEFKTVCPICKKSILDKLRTTNIITIDWTKLSYWIYGILYGMIVVWSLVMVSLLKRPMDLLAPFIVSCIVSPIYLGIVIIISYIILENECPRYLRIFEDQGYLLIIPNFASYFVLLIACFVSYYHPSLLSTNNVVLIFLAINNIIPALLFFMVIIGMLGIMAVKISTSIYRQMCRSCITTSEIAVQDNLVSDV